MSSRPSTESRSLQNCWENEGLRPLHSCTELAKSSMQGEGVRVLRIVELFLKSAGLSASNRT